jgi:DNA-binding transcriptional LysR family regulator
MDITIDEIEAFVSIAALGGFTGASTSLNRSQPAITRRIHKLERTLDTALFERAGRRVALTDAGTALLPHAEAALAAIREGERAIREQASRARGSMPLRIAIVGTLADSHIVDALGAFRSAFADAAVELQTATSREVSALVRSGEAALGVRYFPDADPALESIALGSERLFLVVPARHRITADRLPDLRALGGERWIGFPPDRRQPESFGHLLERQLIASGLPSPAITPVDSLTAQKRLVQAGLGITLMPKSSIREELRIGSLRAVAIDTVKEALPVIVIQRRGGYRSRLATAFITVLRKHTPHLTGDRVRRGRRRARRR